MICHVFISGYVQGIGFRQFVKKNADKLDLKGWASNTFDNRVEAQFFGSKENIEKMLELCRKGPFLSEVKNMKVKWLADAQNDFEDFKIVV